MKIAIIGSGEVGRELAKGFRDSGHSAMIGTRTPAKLADWQNTEGADIGVDAVKTAARFGDIVVLATAWAGVTPALESAGESALDGKIIIDVTNPLSFGAEGGPPALALAYPDSAGKRVQELIPGAKVVKCFNIINARLMAHPSDAAENPDMFLAGNDDTAKVTVTRIAEGWGWTVHDLGGIEQSYILEAFALLWIVYGFKNNHWTHVFKLINQAP